MARIHGVMHVLVIVVINLEQNLDFLASMWDSSQYYTTQCLTLRRLIVSFVLRAYKYIYIYCKT